MSVMYPDTPAKRIRLKPSPKAAKSAHILLTDTSSDEDFNKPKVPSKPVASQKPTRSYTHDFNKQKKPTEVTSLPPSPVKDSQYWPAHSAPRPRTPPFSTRIAAFAVKPQSADDLPSMEEIHNPPSQAPSTPSQKGSDPPPPSPKGTLPSPRQVPLLSKFV